MNDKSCWLDNENDDENDLHDMNASDTKNEDFSTSLDASEEV